MSPILPPTISIRLTCSEDPFFQMLAWEEWAHAEDLDNLELLLVTVVLDIEEIPLSSTVFHVHCFLHRTLSLRTCSQGDAPLSS